jgi:iron-sulfur cluster repair protein YtfE (RIC family)
MLLIRPPSPGVSSEHPGGLLRRDLLACHGHIRRFSALALRLAEVRDVAAEELTGAARALVDYFGRALPLHVIDEEDSLRPRLLALPEDATLVRALECMHAEHGPIEVLVADALPRWRELLGAPSAAEVLEAQRGELRELAGSLDAAFTRHLDGEERLVFPALERLDIEDLVGIRAEMRRRRVSVPPPG